MFLWEPLFLCQLLSDQNYSNMVPDVTSGYLRSELPYNVYIWSGWVTLLQYICIMCLYHAWGGMERIQTTVMKENLMNQTNPISSSPDFHTVVLSLPNNPRHNFTPAGEPRYSRRILNLSAWRDLLPLTDHTNTAKHGFKHHMKGTCSSFYFWLMWSKFIYFMVAPVSHCFVAWRALQSNIVSSLQCWW